jgi:NAD(P)-dependent dehydrogenase (short-subunit alcohol dehydrogenase family)
VSATPNPLVLVTGSTDGIGLATARQLGQAGARVIVHGRNQPRVEAALATLRAAAPGASFQGVSFDLGTMAAVRRGADEVRALAPQLDVLIHNAGVFAHDRIITADGFELTLAVNYVAPLLLTELIPAATVINVASMAHLRGELDLDDLELERGYAGYAAYARSKLAQVMHALSLAEAGQRAFSLHPGVVSTKLLRAGFAGVRGVSTDDGAATSVRLALAPDEVPSGSYLSDGRVTPPAVRARDAGLRAELSRRIRSRLGLASA